MKCKDCEFKSFYAGNGGLNRYYCEHPEGSFARSECEPTPLICRTERHSSEMTIKTAPKWCPLRRKDSKCVD